LVPLASIAQHPPGDAFVDRVAYRIRVPLGDQAGADPSPSERNRARRGLRPRTESFRVVSTGVGPLLTRRVVVRWTMFVGSAEFQPGCASVWVPRW
jgi:hypothetical protein